MNARRRRGEQLIHEEKEKYRGMTETWGAPGVLIKCRLEKKLYGNRPIRKEGANPFNESVIEKSREITLFSPWGSRADDQTLTV